MSATVAPRPPAGRTGAAPVVGRLSAWWFAPLPRARVAWLRTAVYLFVPVDVLLTTPWVAGHGDLAPELYHPLLVGRLLHLPAPTPGSVRAVEIALLASAVLAATGRLPRLLGATVFALYLDWMLVAFSYGKVDHDRFAFLVALAVLPTAGRARWGERGADDAAGWALRCVQVAVVCTYFLSTWAKFRYGGVAWLNSATLVTAVIRKGTDLGTPLLGVPWLLRATQWAIVAFELSSVAILAVRRESVRYLWVATCFAFHAMTFATISIVFLPHCVALLAFLPLERLAAARSPGRAGRPAGAARAPA